MYDIRLHDAGLNTNVSYKVNTTNQYEYRYGNKLTVNMLGYYKFRLGANSNIAPNTGLLYEQAEKDVKDRSRIVEESGGYSITYTMGTEWSYKTVSVGANYQVPFRQYLANGKARSLNRLMLHVSFSL
jgi:hypothetical protein